MLLIKEIAHKIQNWFKAERKSSRARNELYRLSDKELQDIGISRGEIPFLFHKNKYTYCNK